ncbi:inter-alpha-trypsin inhibitor heavy chain H5 isoform X1 [Conger conger]|uniref:inter-alpha-trypsin inhibitor heavy chain H5 isoform X1 n=1 Tax=Conger conger TaxID=82655 RepID=UPI002A59C8C5|nr:inter-alpha-trypsin inhibitor heavy chain H5 isoform X1 [Conger conger]
MIITFLLCLSPFAMGQLGLDPEDDKDLIDLDLGIALRRVPRQVKALLNKEAKPHIQDLSVKTTIISRYAFTAVSCTMLNRHSAATKGVFQVLIPPTAYVSNFTMIIAGRVYPSEVKPKEKKVKQVKDGNGKSQKDKQGGQSASEMETFQVSVSVPGKNRAVFLLTYEELLQRRLGRYEHVTSLRPLQLVSRLSVDVTIVDGSEITHLEVLPLRNGKSSPGTGAKTQGRPTLPVTTTIKQNKTYCKITFNPNIVQQARIATNGILGDFVVRYDVERELGIGDVQVLNGHFVHYFAPKDLPVVPKNVVFVIDTSASMVGTKIRQTKEALFTILKDLRPNDRFNFISFSNRIKVWQVGQLVSVTPNNIRDAKKFIYMITPTGGTDINGAIQSGSSLLSNYLSSTGDHHNSVSLIIFLTDGRPTVGERKSPSILSNTKSAVQEQFCIFTIGIGNDVDYRLLERMSLENCGMMRRIREDSDASAMLKGFYDEIGTPLLSDIRVGYTEDSVQYVTQNLFTNYFNGSEIVIAGKLTNQSAETLHVQVTASNSDKSIVLETDVALQERERETQRQVEAANAGSVGDDYAERVWGFLSVNDGLKSRLRSHNSQEREEFTKQVTNLSLTYNLLTPLTTMVLETPDALLNETVPNASAATAEPPEDEGQDKPQSLHRNTQQPGKAVRKPVKKAITISKTSADGDPHFVVEFPLSKLTVCFNINGEPGQVLRLVSDHKHSGVTVNGKLIGAPAPANSRKQQRTYFSSIIVVVERPRRAYIEITPRKVILDGKDRLVLPCDTTVAVESDGLGVAIVGRSNVTVTVQGTIGFVVLVHQYKNPAPYQRDHLGFYISNSKGLSKDSHGLLGQFLYQEIGLTELPSNATVDQVPKNISDPLALSTIPISTPSRALKIKDRTVAVVKKTRKIYSGTQTVNCWFVKNNAAKLIDGQYEDYVVSHLFDTGDGPHGTN